MADDSGPVDVLSQLIQERDESQSFRKRRRKKRRWWRKLKLIYVGYALVPIVLVGVFLTVLAVDSFSQVTESQDDLTTVFNSISDKSANELTLQDYDQVDGALVALNAALQGANSRTKPLRLLSVLSADNSARFGLLDASIYATTGSRHFLAGLKPTVVLLDRGGAAEGSEGSLIGDPTGERSVELLQAGRNRFLQAQQQLDVAKGELDNIDLDGVSPAVLLDINTLREFIENIETYNGLAIEAPQLLTLMLGLDQMQTYLILAQNSDEIRPSGGYVSTWGWMRVRSGRVQEYDYSATTAESPDPPPASLASLLEIPDWWFQFDKPIYTAWDGSWYADFPSTAEMAAWYYDNGSNPYIPVNGVIGVDLVAVEYVVDALGTVVVPEYDNVRVTTDNFREVVYAIRADSDVPLDHKRFVAALYKQVIADWQKATPRVKSDINKAFLRALREKHIMLYFVDGTLQQSLGEIGWTGSQTVAQGHDFLMLADANIGSKSSRAVQRRITYDATVEADKRVNSRLSILYNFSSVIAGADPAVRPEHYSTQDYFSLLQVFTPSGTQLVESNNITQLVADDTNDEYIILVGYVNVPYDESTRVQFQYNSANLIDQVGSYDRYRLLLEKQPGTIGDGVTVTVSLPPGSHVVAIDPAPSATYELGRPVLEFNLVLRTDTWIEIIYE